MKLLIVIYPFLYLIVPILQLWCVNFAEVKPSYPIKLICFFMIIYSPIYILINALNHNIINSSIIYFGCILIFYNICGIFNKIKTKKRISTKLLNIIFLIVISIVPFLPTILNQKILITLSNIIAWTAIFVSIIYFLDLAIKNLSIIEKDKKNDDYNYIKLTTHNSPPQTYII